MQRGTIEAQNVHVLVCFGSCAAKDVELANFAAQAWFAVAYTPFVRGHSLYQTTHRPKSTFKHCCEAKMHKSYHCKRKWVEKLSQLPCADEGQSVDNFYPSWIKINTSFNIIIGLHWSCLKRKNSLRLAFLGQMLTRSQPKLKPWCHKVNTFGKNSGTCNSFSRLLRPKNMCAHALNERA